jgi:hypothetical protein
VSSIARLVAIIVVACVVSSSAAGIVSGLIIQSSINAGNATQARKLFAAQVSGCQRQNRRTRISNTNASATWRFDSVFEGALTQPSSRPQTEAQKRLLLAFRSRLSDTIRSLTWTPVNDRCSTAPTVVQLPVAFSTRQPQRDQLSRT